MEPRQIAQAATPPEPVAAIAPGNPAEIALEASQQFFESAQVVVLASSTEPPAITRAASLAVTLGTPLLLTAPPGENIEGKDLAEQADAGTQAGSLNTELLRLGTRAVLTVGEVSLHQLDTTSLVVQPLPDSDEDLETIVGGEVREIPPPAQADAMEDLSMLDVGEIYTAEDLGAAPSAYGSLPKTLPAERNERVTVFTTTDTDNYAGVATARAAGARVFVGSEPASLTPIVDHLAIHPSRPVLGFGEDFANLEDLQRMVSSLHAGQVLPSGAQLVFRADGHNVDVVTVTADIEMREKGVDEAADVLDVAARRAKSIEDASGHRTAPGVVVTARTTSSDDLNYWAETAEAADQYLILTVRASGNLHDVVSSYEQLLTRPGVGLRIDASSLKTIDAGEVNDVVVYLRRLAREERLPQRLLIVDLGKDTRISHLDSLTSATREVALTLTIEHEAGKHWRAVREEVGDAVKWGVAVSKVKTKDDKDTTAEYPPPRELLGKDGAHLMTYR